ncbi:MAG: hypothetical protein MUP20_05610, partial [Methyloceanibacter sp.]|nr:hypothetical protein [Methyloceanibacter sp.]
MEWLTSRDPVPYDEAVRIMEARASLIAGGEAAECAWLLEHPPLYTAGTSANPSELLDPHRFPVFRTGRGGRYTYHGPGQRVAYVMLDLSARGRDVRAYVTALEDWLTWNRPLLIRSYINYQFLRDDVAPVYEEAGLPEALLFAMMAT